MNFAEAEILAQLNHSNIVRVFDYGVHEDKPFIVMEFLDGPTLSDELKKNKGRLADEMIAQFVEEIGGALEASHNKGLVHRDLKPDNIKIVSSGESGRNRRFVLLDFGIAKQLDATKTHTRAGYGTPEYMSPEQVQCVKTTHKADIYSFGIILFELFSGRTIFPLPPKPVILDLAKVQTKHVEESPPKLSHVTRRTIRPEIVTLIDHCLAKDPAKRPKSIAEVRKTWHRIYEPPAAKWSLWVKAVIAACTLTLAVLLIWAALRSGQPWLPEAVSGFEFVPEDDTTTLDGRYYQKLVLQTPQGTELTFTFYYHRDSNVKRFYATELLTADTYSSLAEADGGGRSIAAVRWDAARKLAKSLGGNLPDPDELSVLYFDLYRVRDSAKDGPPNIDQAEWTSEESSPGWHRFLPKEGTIWPEVKTWEPWQTQLKSEFGVEEDEMEKAFRIVVGTD